MATTVTDQITGNGETVAYKAPCRVATTGNIFLDGLITIDGVAVVSGDRVLVRSQADDRENGIYIVNTGKWQRARDFDSRRDVTTGTRVSITSGETYTKAEFMIASAAPISIDVSPIVFSRADLAGQAQDILDLAEAAASLAEAAAEVALGAMSSVVLTEFPTKAIAEAYTPDVAPETIKTTFYGSDYMPGSGSRYKKSGSDTGDLVIQEGGSNPVGYVLREPSVYPEQFGADGTMPADTAAFAKARAYAAANGARIRLRAREYVIDENVGINDNNIYIEGDHPKQSTLRLPSTRNGWLLTWGNTNTISGGGLSNARIAGSANIPTGGNGGCRVGTGLVNNTRGDDLKFNRLTFDGFAQYGFGAEGANNLDCDDIAVINHGFTAQNPGSCIGFYIYPKITSREGRIHDIFSEISDAAEANGTNSAAIKLQTMNDLRASKLVAIGGLESVISIDSINYGRLIDLVVQAKTGTAGLAVRSRSPAHAFTSLQTVFDGVQLRHGVGGGCRVVLGSGQEDGSMISVENVHMMNMTGPLTDFVFTNYSLVTQLHMNNIRVRAMRLSYALSSATAPASGLNTAWDLRNIRTTINSALEISSSRISDADFRSGSFNLIGSNNKVRGMDSLSSGANGIEVAGSNNRFFDTDVVGNTGRSYWLRPGSNNNTFFNAQGKTNGTGVLDQGTGNVL